MKIKERVLYIFTILFAIVYFLNFTIAQVFVPNTAIIYYILLISLTFFLINKNKVLYILLPLISSSILSMILSSDLLDDSLFRWISWMIIILISGPILFNIKIINLRNLIWWSLIYIFVAITIISFFWIIFKLPSIRSKVDLSSTYYFDQNYFRNGIAQHEMILAPISGVSAIYTLHNLITLKKGSIYRYLLFCIFIISIATVIMASSRIVITSLLLSIIVFLKNKRLNIPYYFKKNVGKVLIALCLTISFLPQISESLSNFLEKNSRLESKGINNSREGLWESRLIDFYINPVFGVGFYSVSRQVQNDSSKRSGITKGGNIEYGSIYLQTLSTMGIFGFIMLIVFILKIYKIAINNKLDIKNDLYKVIFVFLIFHGLAEAYIYSAGSMFCIFFWLTVSQIVTIKYTRVKKENNNYNLENRSILLK